MTRAKFRFFPWVSIYEYDIYDIPARDTAFGWLWFKCQWVRIL